MPLFNAETDQDNLWKIQRRTFACALAVAIGQPELAPIAGVIGEKVAKENGVSYKVAMHEAKDTYKK